MNIFREFWYFWRAVFLRFYRDGCANRAAALAFASVLSLVPLFTVSFTLLTAFPLFQELAQKTQDFIIQNFVATSAQIIQAHLQIFVHQTSKLSGLGLFFLLATAVLMVFNMEQAFNAIWRAKKRRRFASAFLVYWAVLTLAPILIGIGLAISTYVISLPLISTAAKILGIKKMLFIATPFLSTLTAFTLLYWAVPNCKVKFSYAILGGLIATVLFELAKQCFVLYITRFSVYKLLYGALAAVPIFLVWIYVCWVIILFGAVVSAVFESKK